MHDIVGTASIEYTGNHDNGYTVNITIDITLHIHTLYVW